MKLLFNLNEWIYFIHKSLTVERMAGNEIQRLHFVCDGRPVFNQDHTAILGFTSVTIMKISFRDQLERQRLIEFALSESDLDQLIQSSIDAFNKTKQLKRTLRNTTSANDRS